MSRAAESDERKTASSRYEWDSRHIYYDQDIGHPSNAQPACLCIKDTGGSSRRRLPTRAPNLAIYPLLHGALCNPRVVAATSAPSAACLVAASVHRDTIGRAAMAGAKRRPWIPRLLSLVAELAAGAATAPSRHKLQPVKIAAQGTLPTKVRQCLVITGAGGRNRKQRHPCISDSRAEQSSPAAR